MGTAVLESTNQMAMRLGAAAVPGSASTLGWRYGRTPRATMWLATGGSSASVPAIFTEDHEQLRAASSFMVPSVRMGVAVGAFEGLSLLPTLRGFLALDLLVQGGFAILPGSKGYLGSASNYTLGARIGIVRESFDVPGVTLSVRHTLGGMIEQTGQRESPIWVSAEPRITSLRATVGKDLIAVGIILGAGLDLYGADARYAMGGERSAGRFSGSRNNYFFGLAHNFLFVQVSAEAGFAGILESVDEYTAHNQLSQVMNGGALFADIAIRLTI